MNVLIFANGQTEDGEMVRRALAQAGAGALIVAADGGALMARHYGLHIDTVLGDMDSLTDADLEALEAQGALLLKYPAEKEETDLELALMWAVEQKATWLRIIGATGARLDQTLSNIYLLALPILAGLDVQMVAGKQAMWLIGAGTNALNGQPGDTISLIPLNGTVRGIRTENLYYPLRDEDLYFGPARGVSNVMTAERATVTVREGVLLVVHTLGRA